MKYNFGKYTYYNPTVTLTQGQDVSQYAFNVDKYRELKDAGDYEGLYSYLMERLPNDPKERMRYITNARILRDEGPKQRRIREEANPETIMAMDFNSNYKNNTLSNISNGDNKFYNEYKKQWDALGSTKDNHATSLSITFQPQKRKLFGIDVLDWVLEDNNSTSFEAFTEKVSLAELRNSNIIPKHNDDGSVTITFGKDKALAKKIIENTPSYDTGGFFRRTISAAFDVLVPQIGIVRNTINHIAKTFSPEINGIDSEGNYIDNWYIGDQLVILHKLKQTINDSKKIEENYMNNHGLTDGGYVGGTLLEIEDDEMYNLTKLYQEGKITESEWEKQYTASGKGLWTKIKGIQDFVGNIYTNENSDSFDDSINKLDPLTAKGRKQAVEEITSLDPKYCEIYGMISDGRFGILIRQNAKTDEEGNIIKTHKDYFIPNFLVEDIQKNVYADNKYLAAKKVSDMNTWGTDYITTEGKRIERTNNGLYYNGINLSNDEAEKLIALDIAKEDLRFGLEEKYMNEDNKIFNPEAFISQARAGALAAVQNLYGAFTTYNEQIRDYVPISIASMDDVDKLFNTAFTSIRYNENYYNNKEKEVPINAELRKYRTDTEIQAYKSLYDVYQYILQSLYLYNINNE